MLAKGGWARKDTQLSVLRAEAVISPCLASASSAWHSSALLPEPGCVGRVAHLLSGTSPAAISSELTPCLVSSGQYISAAASASVPWLEYAAQERLLARSLAMAPV